MTGADEMFEEMTMRRRLAPRDHWSSPIVVPLSQGWEVGSLVYVGGQVSLDADGEPIGVGDIGVQTREVFENIKRVLAEAGATWADVIKLNTYYVYAGDDAGAQAYWEAMTEVRLRYLCDPGPAATAVRVRGLMHPDLLIEAEVIAYLERPSDGNGR